MKLRDALERLDKELEPPPGLVPYWLVAVAAARRVAEAPEVWWCEHHMSSGTDQSCLLAFAARLGEVHCRMVRKLLVDPPKETE